MSEVKGRLIKMVAASSEKTIGVEIKAWLQTEVMTQGIVHLSGADIVRLLQHAGHDISDDAYVSVQVPGGGDWSSTALDLDKDATACVVWTKKQSSTS